MNRKFYLAVALFAAFIAAGCKSRVQSRPAITYDELTQLAGQKPTSIEAQKLIFDYLSRTLKDPDSIKQFSLLEPMKPMRWFVGQSQEFAWLACFEYNAKNSYGGYVGLQKDGVAIRNSNGISQIVTNVNWAGTYTGCH